jgi:hypothetical protein
VNNFKEKAYWLLDFVAALASWLLLGVVIPNWNIVIKELEEQYFSRSNKEK